MYKECRMKRTCPKEPKDHHPGWVRFKLQSINFNHSKLLLIWYSWHNKLFDMACLNSQTTDIAQFTWNDQLRYCAHQPGADHTSTRCRSHIYMVQIPHQHGADPTSTWCRSHINSRCRSHINMVQITHQHGADHTSTWCRSHINTVQIPHQFMV